MVKMLIIAVITTLLATTHSMIMRNNALMTKMVSQFQGKERRPPEHKIEDLPPPIEEKIQEGSPAHVLSLMQNVLCKNFPSVPCDLITKDQTLRSLIEKSIQQLKYKKLTMERTTTAPNFQLTLFPVINSEDLSNFLQVSNTGSFKQKKTRKKPKKTMQEKNRWWHDKQNRTRTPLISGRKKIRKFYPHKYKDKGEKKDLHDYSDEKLSMSVENPQELSSMKRKHFSFRGEPSDPPVWRIDYMKHGEPSINMYGYDQSDSLKGKLIKTGPNVIVDDNILEHAARKDVLHPDVYIKKYYNRKSSKDSDAMD